MSRSDASRIQGLGELIRQASERRAPPVEQWNPPYCGDIGLKIDAQAKWSYRDSIIARQKLVKLFASVLRCEKDGRHYVVTPAEKIDVAVADAPFLAEEMQVEGSGAEQKLVFRTNVDDILNADAAHPMLFREQEASGGLIPYVRVRGRLYARLTRALYFELVELAVPDAENGDETLVVVSDGCKFPIAASNDAAFYDFEV